MHCRAVSEQFSRALRDRARRKSNVHDRIRAHALSLRLHALYSLCTRLLQQLRITLEFATDEILEASHNIATDMLGAHGTSTHEAVKLLNLMSWHLFRVGKNYTSRDLMSWITL